MTPEERRREIARSSRHLPDALVPGSAVSVNLQGPDPYQGGSLPGRSRVVRGRTIREDPRLAPRPMDVVLDPLMANGLPRMGTTPFQNLYGLYNTLKDVDLTRVGDMARPLLGAYSAAARPFHEGLADAIDRYRNQASSGSGKDPISGWDLDANEDILADQFLTELGMTGLDKRQLAELGHMQMSGASETDIRARAEEIRGGTPDPVITEDSEEGFLNPGPVENPYARFPAEEVETQQWARPAVSDEERKRLDSFTKDEYWRDLFGTDQAVGVESNFDTSDWDTLDWIGKGAFVPINMLDTMLAEVGLGPEFERQRTMMALEAQEIMAKNQMNDAQVGMMSPVTEEERRAQQIQAAMLAGAQQAWGTSSSPDRPTPKQKSWIETLFASRKDRDRQYMNQKARTAQAVQRSQRLQNNLDQTIAQAQTAQASRFDAKQDWRQDQLLNLERASQQNEFRRGEFNDNLKLAQTIIGLQGQLADNAQANREAAMKTMIYLSDMDDERLKEIRKIANSKNMTEEMKRSLINQYVPTVNAPSLWGAGKQMVTQNRYQDDLGRKEAAYQDYLAADEDTRYYQGNLENSMLQLEGGQEESGITLSPEDDMKIRWQDYVAKNGHPPSEAEVEEWIEEYRAGAE